MNKFILCFVTLILVLIEVEKVFATKIPNISTSDSSNESILSNSNSFSDGIDRISKRLLWMNKRRKFVLPTGTILTLQPKITLPVFRNKPFNEGLNSDIQATWFFYMYFDKLGMTSDDHVWPIRMPPFYPFGDLMIRKDDKKEPNDINKTDEEDRRANAVRNAAAAFSFLKLQTHRQERSILSLPPPENIHGGERAIILPRIESILGSVGMEGRGCMLRAICEIHEYPLEKGYGFFGELVTLFFSISKSRYARSHMPEYLKAEEAGKSGECSSYLKNCSKSIFHWEENKYSENIQNQTH